MTSRPPSRSRGVAFAGLLAGGLLGLLAGSRPWWRAEGSGASVAFTGNEASGGLTWALPAVVLAGELLALVLRARGRRVVAVLVGLAGVGMVITGLLRSAPTAEGVRTRLAQVSLVDAFTLTPTAWPWVFAGAGLLATTGAAVMFGFATRWPVRSTRFERASATGALDPADDATAAWQALDAGEDPTVDPRVQSDVSGDTMEIQGGSDTRREPS
jgi:uncharacterized membrane protein (TIGR02234 family)